MESREKYVVRENATYMENFARATLPLLAPNARAGLVTKDDHGRSRARVDVRSGGNNTCNNYYCE